jgi:hypothetical protein
MNGWWMRSIMCEKIARSIKPKWVLSLNNPISVKRISQCIKNYSVFHVEKIALIRKEFYTLHEEHLKPFLENHGFFDSHLEKNQNHAKNRDWNLKNARSLFDRVAKEYEDALKKARSVILRDLKIKFPVTEESFQGLSENEKQRISSYQLGLISLYWQFIDLIFACVRSAFYGFESSCRICSSCSHPGFALEEAKGKVIYHGYIWKNIKEVGQASHGISTSQNYTDCFFNLGFLYALCIQLRILLDYADYRWVSAPILSLITEVSLFICKTVETQRGCTDRCIRC